MARLARCTDFYQPRLARSKLQTTSQSANDQQRQQTVLCAKRIRTHTASVASISKQQKQLVAERVRVKPNDVGHGLATRHPGGDDKPVARVPVLCTDRDQMRPGRWHLQVHRKSCRGVQRQIFLSQISFGLHQVQGQIVCALAKMSERKVQRGGDVLLHPNGCAPGG